jgi:formate-dependent nitrite reductase membrane component NrfD
MWSWEVMVVSNLRNFLLILFLGVGGGVVIIVVVISGSSGVVVFFGGVVVVGVVIGFIIGQIGQTKRDKEET